MEYHLVLMHKLVEEFKPAVVIVDPITNFVTTGLLTDVKSMLTRLVDFLKGKQITAFFTSLTPGGSHVEQTEEGISSLVDTWLLVRDLETNGQRHRALYVLKSRGMPHATDVRNFSLTSHGMVFPGRASRHSKGTSRGKRSGKTATAGRSR